MEELKEGNEDKETFLGWFLGFTAIHGLSHIGATRFKLGKLLWFFAFVGGVVMTTWNVQKVVEDYQSNDVS